MTGSPHMSAVGGGMGQQTAGLHNCGATCDRVKEFGGLRCTCKSGPKHRNRKDRGGKRINVLLLLKRIQSNEFKFKIELKQTKIMLYHECNNKLL
jgi:hypothetical protein